MEWIPNGNVSSDFRDRGGGGGGGGGREVGHLGLLEEFGSLDGSPNAHAAAAEVLSSDLFCFLVEGVLILVTKFLKKKTSYVQA